MTRDPADAEELAHPAGATSAWTETWEWRLVDPQRAIGVAVAVVRRPAERRVSYLGVVVGAGRQTVAVVEHDIVAPASGLELRSSGIWADHVCETPFAHWSLGLEAFGLAFDEPDDAVTTGRGHLTPVGADLEWEDDGRPAAGADPTPAGDAEEGVDAGYRTVGVAHGEVLIGPETIELDGLGERRHRWGTGPRLAPWTTRPAPAVDVRVALDGPPRAVVDDGTGAAVEWWLEAVPVDGGTGLVMASRPLA